MKKAPIKIPTLIPSETLDIAGEKVCITGFKPSDKVYDIAIEHIKKRGLEIQAKINKVLLIEEEIEGKKELRRKNDLELTEEEGKVILGFKNEVDDLEYELIYGNKQDEDLDDERMTGPMALLAQRGLKRFFYPSTTSSELDELDDIEITEGDIKLIANTMVNLAQPPSGIVRSIQARKKEQEEADKGK